jgi:hypothetical protein
MYRCLTFENPRTESVLVLPEENPNVPWTLSPAVTGYLLSNRLYKVGDLVAILVGGMLASMQVQYSCGNKLHPGLRIQTHFITETRKT